MAWILACTKDANLRNSAEAVEYAKGACELTVNNQPAMLDTLAAAHAAAGNFPKAVKTAQKAIELAESADKKELTQKIQTRLQLYQANQVYIGNR